MTVTPAPLPESLDAGRDPGFAVYVHWPFCLAKCPYCDFNSHVREGVDHARWRAALMRELDHFANETKGGPATSIFFGGGTPSLMAPDTVAGVIDAVERTYGLDDAVEITLEANPTSAEAEAFAGFRAAGVNRISLGVQSLNDDALRFLGRQHSAEEALRAVALARRHVPRVSFDLMTGRPGQTPEGLRSELGRALDEGPDHIAIYQLTIEPGTAFHAAWRRGELVMPGDDAAAALYDITVATLAEAGLPAYEISNHARPGAECRHNLTYWRYGDYVGVGPGAHGRLTANGEKLATRQHRAPEAWLAAVEADGHATRARHTLTRDERLAELVMMGLRLEEGIARDAFRRELGAEPEACLDGDRLAALSSADYLLLNETGLVATPEGRTRLDSVLAYLLG